jgi:DNA-binding response OmpR family regulator
MTTQEPQPAVILVVDDKPENIGVLFDFLNENNFEVLVARDGENALELLEYADQLPDLVLLDVMMPGIDGFETCVRIKTTAKTQDIPIIFMTALSDTIDKVKGLSLGAVDYITKPIQQDEVLARINTHLTVRKLQQQLQTKNAELAAQHRLALQLNAQLQQKNQELEDQYSLTLRLNAQLQQEIEGRRRAETELQKTNEELFALGNFSSRPG